MSDDHDKTLPYEELRRRLEEAEETIRAIRNGEIDALVVSPSSGEQVFTLHGGEDGYRAFMETMGQGAAAVSGTGEILYVNSVLAAMNGRPASALLGRSFSDQFDRTTATELRNLIASAETSGSAASSREVIIENCCEERHYLVSAEPLQIGVMAGWAITFTDLTERVRAEASVSAGRAARAIIASANEAVIVCDLHGRITHTNAAVTSIHEGDIVGQPFHEAIDLRISGSIGLLQAEDIIRLAIGGTPVQGLEARAPQAPRTKDLLISAAPLAPTEGTISGCVVTLIDLSQRKAAERQQMLLMAELDHRVKNTLTLVLSILGRTSESDIETFKRTFAGRIHALAATHNLLSNNSWAGLSVGEVLSAELAPYGASNRVDSDVADIKMKPRAAVAIGLVFHELASNAVKYGALSVPKGHVEVRLRDRTGAGSTVIEWIERGGPAVMEPTRTGFGRTVITKSLSYARDGGSELIFDPNGIRCLIRIPSDDLAN